MILMYNSSTSFHTFALNREFSVGSNTNQPIETFLFDQKIYLSDSSFLQDSGMKEEEQLNTKMLGSVLLLGFFSIVYAP